MSTKVKIILAIVGVAMLTVGVYSYFFVFIDQSKQIVQENIRCLKENEVGKYKEVMDTDGTYKSIITITDKTTGQSISSFDVSNVAYRSFANHQFQRCHVYVEKKFGYDYQRDVVIPDKYYREVWRYDYAGKGEKLYKFSDFRVDDTETYIAYVNSTIDDPANYSFNIINIKTDQIAFSIKLQDLVNQYNVKPAPITLVDPYDNFMRFQLNNEYDTAVRVYTDDWHIEVY